MLIRRPSLGGIRRPGVAPRVVRGLCLAVLVGFGAVQAQGMGRRPGKALEYEGRRYRGLKDLAALYGGAYREDGKELILAHQQGRFVFSPGTRKAHFRDRPTWLHREPVRIGRRWCITEADAESVVGPLLRPGPVLARVGTRVVMLDPGHGGRDQGATGVSARPEKALTLDLAKRVKSRLEKAGIQVMMTRADDRYLSLGDRSKIALARRADLFVSLHFNQASNQEASGIEVFALTAQGQPSTLDAAGGSIPPGAYRGHAHQAAGAILSDRVHASLVRSLKPVDRGVRRARFAVLKHAPCPAVLAECGFLSNPAEARLIGTDQHLDALADAIALGLRTYIGEARAAHLRSSAGPRGERPSS